MPTGLAILFSFGLAIFCGIIDALLWGMTGEIPSLTTLMVFGTAIWAGFDASKIEFKKYKTSLGSLVWGGGGVFAAVLLLWIIAFPWYLASRGKILNGKAKLRDKYEGEAFKRLTMKRHIICRNCGSVGSPKKRYGIRLTLSLISWNIPVLNLWEIFLYFKSEQNELTVREFIKPLASPSPYYGGLDLVNVIISPFIIWWSIALILTIWLLMTRRPICAKCGAKKNSFVPLGTPEGERLLSQSEEVRKVQSEKVELTSSVDKTCETDIATQLDRLARLKDKGVLTNEEFQAQKAKLLSS